MFNIRHKRNSLVSGDVPPYASMFAGRCRASRPRAAPLHKEPVRPLRAPAGSAAATSSPRSLSSSAWTSLTANSRLQPRVPRLALRVTRTAPRTTRSPRVSSRCRCRESSRASRWRMSTGVRAISRISIIRTSPTSCSPPRVPSTITAPRRRTPPSKLHPDTYGRTPALSTVSDKTIWRRRTRKTRYPDSRCFHSDTRNTAARACPPAG